jgi:hypothetical protein
MEDLILEASELRMLSAFQGIDGEWLAMPAASSYARECIDMLVLSGLLERRGSAGNWFPEWRLTPDGMNFINLLAYNESSGGHRQRPVC